MKVAIPDEITKALDGEISELVITSLDEEYVVQFVSGDDETERYVYEVHDPDLSRALCQIAKEIKE